MAQLRVALAQVDTCVGDLDGNAALVLARGLPPFIGHAPTLFDQHRMHQRIRHEEAQVHAQVALANAAKGNLGRSGKYSRATGFTVPIAKETL